MNWWKLDFVEDVFALGGVAVEFVAYESAHF